MVLELVAGPFKNADGIGAVRFSQDSKKLAVRLWTGHCLEVWDVQTQTRDVGVGKRAGGTMSVTPVFWTTKDRTLVTPLSFTDDEATTIYKFDASTLETAFEGHLNAVIGLVLSGDGALLVSASPGDSIKFLTFESR